MIGVSWDCNKAAHAMAATASLKWNGTHLSQRVSTILAMVFCNCEDI